MEAGCSAITSLTLRQSDNSASIVKECDGALIITLVMAKHPANRKVQVSREQVSRTIMARLLSSGCNHEPYNSSLAITGLTLI